MSTAVSRDGTRIAYEQTGRGEPVILVDGAMCHRAFGPSRPLARQLASNFTVFTYDRRGRGESGDTQPYDVEREVEDLAALIEKAGGSAYVYGISSGAALALDATARLGSVRKLAVYEAPFIVDGTHPPRADDYLERMEAMVASGDRSQAVQTFMRTVGVPAIGVAVMRMMPMWRKAKAVAHTLPYDFRVLGDTGAGKPLPPERWVSVKAPVLVMDGGKSPTWMRNAMRELAGVVPGAQHRSLPGQTHMLKPQAVAPVLVSFFAESDR